MGDDVAARADLSMYARALREVVSFSEHIAPVPTVEAACVRCALLGPAWSFDAPERICFAISESAGTIGKRDPHRSRLRASAQMWGPYLMHLHLYER